MITVLCGGVGAARLLRAMSGVMDARDLTAIVNVGDDLVMHGLTICPDLDTITYTLGQQNDAVRGWGLRDESWRVMEMLGALGGDNWFSLGDKDLATHLYRSQRLQHGATKSDVAGELAQHYGITTRLLPASNDEIATMLDTADGPLTFQEYFVRHHHDVTVTGVRYVGGSSAEPAPGVLDALRDAERIVIAPSNPILSLQPILEMPAIATLLRERREDVVAVSPLVGGVALKGPADRLLRELGHRDDNVGIATYYAPYAATLVIDEVDAHTADDVVAAGMSVRVTTTVMANPDHAAQLAREVLR